MSPIDALMKLAEAYAIAYGDYWVGEPSKEDFVRYDSARAALREACEKLCGAVEVLSRIADAYDDNALDDEARKTWGLNDECENKEDPRRIDLYSGRGGKELLTLADCFAARAALAHLTKGTA